MAERRTTVDGLADAIMDGLKEYADLATDTVKDAVKDVSKTVKKDIQANAPKRTGRYKKSWAVKKTAESRRRGRGCSPPPHIFSFYEPPSSANLQKIHSKTG